ncbi:MAG: IS200/IS605 family transposase [Acidobacteria bacterium]|nr:IS200/IS605 family transposase [Acidobacteriota bacterium]
MPHSYAQNRVHIVFSTKERKRLIEPAMQGRLGKYVSGIAQNHGMHVLAVGGVEDHIHVLVDVPPMLPLAKAIQTIKANSSKWMNEHRARRDFAWQEGYGAFSVSASNTQAVIAYIENQAAHHKRRSFEDEFVALLKKHGIPYDPKYVFG